MATAFPNDPTEKPTVIELTRTGCLGRCPGYTVRIFGDGAVVFEGHYFVFAPGVHVAHIAPKEVQGLLAKFKKAGFFTLHRNYTAGMTDNPTYELRLTLGDRAKTVTDYVGAEVGMPASVTDLEKAVDSAAGTDRWIQGTPSTLAALLSESWDFSADTADNRNLFRNALWAGNQALIESYDVGSLDLTTQDDREAPLLCVASARGDVRLVQAMLRSQAIELLDDQLRDRCLSSAAGSGNLDMWKLWLTHGASIPTKRQLYESDALPCAIRSGNPAMVDAVLKLKPDANVSVDSDPILDWIFDWWIYRGQAIDTAALHQILQRLLCAGADVNSRNNIGATPLMMHDNVEAVVQELLSDGADPTLRDDHGSVLDHAREDKCQACVALIEGAIAHKHAASPSPH